MALVLARTGSILRPVKDVAVLVSHSAPELDAIPDSLL